MTSVLTVALEYAQRGWRVVPLHHVADGVCSCGDLGCRRGGKHPLINAWTRAATNNPEKIGEWWDGHPYANVGLVTGPASGFFAVDIDVGKQGEESLAELERQHGSLPETVEHRTGSGGRHILFCYPNGGRVRNSAERVAPGIDVRGDGGLIVAPPSTNITGSYEKITDRLTLAAAPDWLLAQLSDSRPTRPAARDKPKRKSTPDAIPKGQRNVELTRLAGRMRMCGTPPEAIDAALAATNRSRCVPPLPDDEVNTIAVSISSYVGLPWLTSPRTFFKDPRLKGIDRHVLRVLCDYADCHGIVRGVSYQVLERGANHSEDAIATAVRHLEQTGRVTIKRSPRCTNLYTIATAWSSQSSSTPPTNHPHLVDTPAERGSGRAAAAA